MKPVSAALLLLGLAGCAAGPDFKRPAPPAVGRYLPAVPVSAAAETSDAQHFLIGTPVPPDWWTAFGSPELNSLVERAFRANPTVGAAQAALRRARESLAMQHGAYWPTIGASADASRNRNAVAVLSPTLTSGSALFNLYTGTVDVSYVLDVFGAKRRATESLAASADVARWQLEATYLTVAGNVVTAAIQVAGVDAQVAATRHAVDIERVLLGILHRRFDLGAASGLDVAAQETALAQTETTLPPLERQREAARHLLAVLTGRLPSDADLTTLELTALALPADVPVGVPSELVTRRPDVRAAEANLHAATAEVGVAVTSLLPQITLGAALGTSTTAIQDLFRTYTKFWSAGATLSQTLFAGGANVHRVRAARAALDGAGANYRQAVLMAFQNVADALRALETDQAALAAGERAAAAADRSLRIARRQVELGGASQLELLNAEAAYTQTSAAVAAARTARYSDTAALYQAVAGPVPAQVPNDR